MFEHVAIITQTHDLKDATPALLVMLGGAFILGSLFCWALSTRKRTSQIEDL